MNKCHGERDDFEPPFGEPTRRGARKSNLSLFFALVALPAAAHHSPAMFDTTKEVVLTGTVTDYSWRNPHVYMAVAVRGADGKLIVQQIEAGATALLSTAGVTNDSVHVGDQVTVVANPNRGSGHIVMGLRLTKADGTTLPLNARELAPPTLGDATATSLAGTWVPQQAGFYALVGAMATSWQFTDKGKAALASNSTAVGAAQADCSPWGVPGTMVMPSVFVVAVDSSEVSFKGDYLNVERIVHLDGQGRPPGLAPSFFGYSIGHWEGNTLVVDTSGFTAQAEGFGFDRPSSGAKHVVERFSLSADRKHLLYEATMEDSEYLQGAVTHRSQWDYRPDQKPTKNPCDAAAARRFATGE